MTTDPWEALRILRKEFHKTRLSREVCVDPDALGTLLDWADAAHDVAVHRKEPGQRAYEIYLDTLQRQWEMPINYPWERCAASYRATWAAVETALASPVVADEPDREFKNFHRMLCERFNYTHDERDWKRDQVSLMEWIASRALASPVVEGWVMVPREPTPEMLAAAGKYADHCAVHNYGGAPDAEGTWEAMLDASPSPPETREGGA